MPDSLSAKLRAALDKRGITQRDLAKLAQFHEATVSLWLSGERTPRVKNLRKLAEALDIEMQELWEGPEATPANEAQQSVLDDMGHLSETQQEAIAAFVRSMRASK